MVNKLDFQISLSALAEVEGGGAEGGVEGITYKKVWGMFFVLIKGRN